MRPRLCKKILTFLMIVAGSSIQTIPTFANTTVTFDKAVHVTTAEGSDLILDIGEYVVAPAQQWIRVTPSGGQAVDAHLLEAQLGKHEEKLTDPLALSLTGVEPDSHHLVLLLPDGKSLEATGSYSGIRSRGKSRKLSRAKMQQIIALSKKKKKAQKTEYRTPRMGTTGGNRSYNLDCGKNAVLVGAMFKSGLWLDALGIICQRVNPQTGALEDEFTQGPAGGGGGDAREKRCKNDGDVVQAITEVRTGSFVDFINFKCSSWEPSQKTPRFSRNSDCNDAGGCGLVGHGGTLITGAHFHGPFFCPKGKVGKAFRGRYGSYIDSVQFVCDFWDK